MENQKSFNEIEESIKNELSKLQRPRIERLKLIIENVPEKFVQKLHDNYLGESPTRAVLSAQFHAILDSAEKEELLSILSKKITDNENNTST